MQLLLQSFKTSICPYVEVRLDKITIYFQLSNMKPNKVGYNSLKNLLEKSEG